MEPLSTRKKIVSKRCHIVARLFPFIIPSSSLGVATTEASLEDNRARRVFTVLLVGT